MQIVGVILLLLSVGLVVGPVGAVVVIYRDDLSQLVIPSQIRDVVNGNPSFILNDNFNSANGDSVLGDTNSFLDNFVAPTFVSANVDYASKTFSVTVNVTNFLKYDLTLNALGTEVQTPDGQLLAAVSLDNPLTIQAGQFELVTIDGSWTQFGETFLTEHSQQGGSANISLVNIVVDVNGVKVELSGPITITVPLSLTGVTITG